MAKGDKNGKVLETIVKIAGEISPTLGKSVEGVSGKLEGVNVKALAAGASIAAIGVGTAVAVGKAVGALAKLGDAFNSGLNDISATTGLVGEELAGMGEVMKEVYGSNLGESMEDVAGGISEVYRQTGLVDEALAETTKAAYALSDTFGYDISESARAAKAMMLNFGISGEEAMNLIASGAQNGLDYSGEMIDSINEYSVQFAKLGFSADDMFSIFQQGADSGAWNLDKVGDAVKEFSIRSIDGSKTTTHAFESLGLNADEMMATFAAGGEDASIAFQGVLAALVDMDDEVQRDLIGVELFGTQWEDLGVEAMAAMSDLQGGAYATGDAIAGIMDVKYDNLTDAFEAVKRQGEVALLPLASTIANAFTKIAPVIGDLFEELGPIVSETVEEMMPFVEEFLAGAMDILRMLMPHVRTFASAILPLLSQLVANLLPPLLDLAEALLPPLLDIINSVLPFLVDLLLQILPIFVQLSQMILPVIVKLINSLLPILMPILEIALQLINEVVMPLLPPLIQIIDALLPAALSLLESTLPILQPLADVLGVVVGWIAKVVGWVTDGLTWVIGLIFGDGAGDVAEAAEVNGYATGGFTNGLSIAGEDPRYPTEAVISFNPAYRSENLSYWAEAGRMLGADYSDYDLGGSANSTYYNMGGVTFAPNITVTGNADKRTIMEAIEEEYPEFMDMLDEYFASKGVMVYG